MIEMALLSLFSARRRILASPYLWQGLPKQFLPLVTEHTLLQDTVLRLRGIAGAGAPLVVANDAHRFLVASS